MVTIVDTPLESDSPGMSDDTMSRSQQDTHQLLIDALLAQAEAELAAAPRRQAAITSKRSRATKASS